MAVLVEIGARKSQTTAGMNVYAVHSCGLTPKVLHRTCSNHETTRSTCMPSRALIAIFCRADSLFNESHYP